MQKIKVYLLGCISNKSVLYCILYCCLGILQQKTERKYETMKEVMETPRLDIIYFDARDIVTTSEPMKIGGGNTDGGFNRGKDFGEV